MHLSRLSLELIINNIKPLERKWIKKARDHSCQLIMPSRALGRIHDIGEQICAIQKTMNPCIDKKAVLVMAGDHGILEEGVSSYPQEITGEMVRTFLKGGAGINAISRQVKAEVQVVDMGISTELDPSELEGGQLLKVFKLGRGTENFAKGPAMSKEQAKQSILIGFKCASDLIAQGVNLIGTGDMGIGNTTPSSAVGAVITKKELQLMVGTGTGLDEPGLRNKREIIRKAIELNQPDPTDGLDILAKVGGFEIGGIVGIILAGAYHNCPVMLDGFISTAGALIAQTLSPEIKDYILAGHCSEEPGHKYMLDFLELRPILDLGMRLGEGSGGAMAMSVVEAAVRVFNEVMTFEQAGVGC